MTVYVIGGGLAGLSAAVRFCEAGYPVTLLEGAAGFGGRCRSYFDSDLNTVLDNGTHLMLSAYHETFEYLDLLGARDEVMALETAFSMQDVRTGEEWSLVPRTPREIYKHGIGVEGIRKRDLLALAKLGIASEKATAQECISADNPLVAKILAPFCVATLNTPWEKASARLLWQTLKKSLFEGPDACVPYLAHKGLSAALVDPALTYLKSHGADVRSGILVTGLKEKKGRVIGFEIGREMTDIHPRDRVVLALPPHALRKLDLDVESPLRTSGLNHPDSYHAIINIHYRLERGLADFPLFKGYTGGLMEWIFWREPILSVTVSAADDHIKDPAGLLALKVWTEICGVFGLGEVTLPAHKVIKEKRATISQSPDMVKRRPDLEERHGNVAVIGDWVDTGLPATIEGAILAGRSVVPGSRKKV